MTHEPLNVAFFGTPEFAIPSLEALERSGHNLLVVTNPDAPSGRSKTPLASPVKVAAARLGLPVLQPSALDHEFLEQLSAWHPDIGVVVAYGHILKSDLLTLPTYGFVNVHPSLLPRHRGANPIAGTILSGDVETGVTIMKLDLGVDTGPIIAQQKHTLTGKETRGELAQCLAEIGAKLLSKTLSDYATGALTPRAQESGQATVTVKVQTSHAEIDWSLRADEIERKVRAFNPSPCAWTIFQGERLKIHEVSTDGPSVEQPGTLVQREQRLGVVSGDGKIVIFEKVQRAGKSATDGQSFANGYRQAVGTQVGS